MENVFNKSMYIFVDVGNMFADSDFVSLGPSLRELRRGGDMNMPYAFGKLTNIIDFIDFMVAIQLHCCKMPTCRLPAPQNRPLKHEILASNWHSDHNAFEMIRLWHMTQLE